MKKGKKNGIKNRRNVRATIISGGGKYHRNSRNVYMRGYESVKEQLSFFLIIADTVFTAPLDRYRHKEARHWVYPRYLRYVGRNVHTYRTYYIKNMDEANIFMKMGARMFLECVSLGNFHMEDIYNYVIYGYKFFLMDIDRYSFGRYTKYTKIKMDRLKLGGLYYLSEKRETYLKMSNDKKAKYKEMKSRIINKNIGDYWKRNKILEEEENAQIEKKVDKIIKKNILEKLCQETLKEIKKKYLKKRFLYMYREKYEENMHLIYLIIKAMVEERKKKKRQYRLQGYALKEKIANLDYILLKKIRKQIMITGRDYMNERVNGYTKKGGKKMRKHYAKELKLFKNLGSRGEYVGKKSNGRRMLLSKYYAYIGRKGRRFGETRLAAKIKKKKLKGKIVNIASFAYKKIKRKEFFTEVYNGKLKSDKNKLNLAKKRKSFIKRGFTFRRKYRRGARYIEKLLIDRNKNVDLGIKKPKRRDKIKINIIKRRK